MPRWLLPPFPNTQEVTARHQKKYNTKWSNSSAIYSKNHRKGISEETRFIGMDRSPRDLLFWVPLCD